MIIHNGLKGLYDYS